VIVKNDPANNGVELRITDLHAGFKSDHYEYKWAFLKAKGSVEVSMSEVQIGVTVGLTDQKLSNGKTVPAFSVKNVDFHIPKDHFSLKIHGNFISKVASLLKGLFKGTIINQIEKQVKDMVSKELPPQLNKIIAD